MRIVAISMTRQELYLPVSTFVFDFFFFSVKFPHPFNMQMSISNYEKIVKMIDPFFVRT